MLRCGLAADADFSCQRSKRSPKKEEFDEVLKFATDVAINFQLPTRRGSDQENCRRSAIVCSRSVRYFEKSSRLLKTSQKQDLVGIVCRGCSQSAVELCGGSHKFGGEYANFLHRRMCNIVERK